MTGTEVTPRADERVRLEECAREPIHIPGAIQPHGALIAVDAGTHAITQVSANCGRVLGVEPSVLLGRSLLATPRFEWAGPVVGALMGGPDATTNPIHVQVAGQPLDAIAHRVDEMFIVEFEPSPTGSVDRLLPNLHAAMRRLSGADTVDALRAEAAREVRRLTGFDRVMVYHFHPDGHGEVVAEDRVGDLEPYLGLHFPASDIPAQARHLYLLKSSRLIAACDYEPAAVVPADNPQTGLPLDLSRAELRSVSPHHLEFMRNMGTAASMSLSLGHDGELLGLISCGHRRPRHVPYLLRRGCEILAQQVTSQLVAMTEMQLLRRRLRAKHVRAQLAAGLARADNVAQGLVGGPVTLVDLVSADGATVCLDQQLFSTGDTPSEAQTAALLARIRSTGSTSLLVCDALALIRPDLAELVPSVAGLIVVPFGGDGDYLIWFRREVVHTVNWLGDQSADNRATPLSPRHSFDQWRETVSGRALAWDAAEVLEAAELRHDIDSILRHKVEAHLAHLGLHDELTGLPNRRMLMDRLEHALHRHARGAPVALLFLDLDGLKRVNDSFGHEIGDALLVQAAQRITRTVRAADSVARLGGDEFVVLCEDTSAAAGYRLAERLVAAFQEPVGVDGQQLRITASVGLAVAEGHRHPADLLREADTAMYLAKNLGRNQVSRYEPGPG